MPVEKMAPVVFSLPCVTEEGIDGAFEVHDVLHFTPKETNGVIVILPISVTSRTYLLNPTVVIWRGKYKTPSW